MMIKLNFKKYFLVDIKILKKLNHKKVALAILLAIASEAHASKMQMFLTNRINQIIKVPMSSFYQGLNDLKKLGLISWDEKFVSLKTKLCSQDSRNIKISRTLAEKHLTLWSAKTFLFVNHLLKLIALNTQSQNLVRGYNSRQCFVNRLKNQTNIIKWHNCKTDCHRKKYIFSFSKQFFQMFQNINLKQWLSKSIFKTLRRKLGFKFWQVKANDGERITTKNFIAVNALLAFEIQMFKF